MNDSASTRTGPAASADVRTGADAAGGLRGAVRRPSRAAAVKDVLLFGALAFPVAVDMLSPLDPSAASWSRAGGLAVLAAAVAVCRAWPTTALLTAITLTLVHGNFVFAMPVLSYLAGRRTVSARPPLWAFTAVFVGGVTLSAVRATPVTVWFPSTLYLVLLGVLPWLVGRYWRQYRELLDAGWERAERLEHAQRIIAERERLRERARIAQDMHDSLGHELALIAVRAGALQVAPGLDDRHRDTAAQLRAGAAEATEQLRQIIGVLREDTAPAGPGPDGPPALSPDDAAPVRPPREGIGHLVERAHASGVPVRLAGDPAEGEGDAVGDAVLAGLPPMVVLTVHRVVQEAVTNAAKHAPGAPVTVHLERRDGTVRATVANGPPPAAPPSAAPPSAAPPLPSGGHGLAGLTERVRLLGGSLHAAPDPGGGFTVTADLPEHPPGRLPGAPPPHRPPPHRPAARPTALTALGTALGLTSTPPGEWTSESARHLARARLRARRGLVTAIAVPTALLALLGAVMAGWYVYVTLNSVLPPGDYAELRVGAPRAEVVKTLPPRQTLGTGLVRRAVPEPPGADCRYYRPDANLLGLARVYRLCFDAGRLTSKDAYDTAELSTEPSTERPKDDP